MPDLIMITGPQAVGKMTVGQELAKLTNFKLFHNHMSIDLVNNFSEKNKAEILYVNIYNKSGRKIDSIVYKDYEFKNLTGKKSDKEHYELLVANVNLDEKLVINFK